MEQFQNLKNVLKIKYAEYKINVLKSHHVYLRDDRESFGSPFFS